MREVLKELDYYARRIVCLFIGHNLKRFKQYYLDGHIVMAAKCRRCGKIVQ